MTSWIIFISFIILILLGIPIGISLGLSTMLVIILQPNLSLDFYVRGLITGLDSFPLVAVIFFTIAGNVMGRGGISQRLLNLANLIFGNLPGGLGMVSIVACMMFAAISGTGSATVAAIGAVMIPAMIKKGYEPNFSGALVATAGTIGVMIPPSVPMIIYAVSAETSVSAMFLAGIFPGILAGLFLILYCFIIMGIKHFKKELVVIKDSSFQFSWDVLWAISVPIIILGGIYGGVFTPTEAAGVGVVYGIIISVFVYKELRLRDLPAIFLESSLLVSCVLIIIGSSVGFGRILTLERVPVHIANFITSITDNKILILLLINILLLIVGTFMETLAAIVILTPILLPIVTAFGVDPVHFGIIMIVNLAIGFITPPLGANLFMTVQVGKLRFDDLAKKILPWILVMVIALMLITYIPKISMFLPELYKSLK